jgi:broad specificity phosphatase PhoE
MPILDLIGSLPGQSAIVVRHAERFAIKGNDAHYTTGLTDKGLADAFDFGNALPGHFGGYRLFHSEAKRCRQTAEQICRSLEFAGKEATVAGPSDIIGISYMLADIDTAFNESERHGNKFIRTWFDGRLEPGIFRALDETLAQHLDYLRSTLASSPGLDIHVTHDWNINVLREGIFGLKHEDAGWPDFLSSMVFSGDNGTLTAHLQDRDRILSAAIPL